jgi:hypothetical protein
VPALICTLALDIVYKQALFQPDDGVSNMGLPQQAYKDSYRYKVVALQLTKEAVESPVEAFQTSIMFSIALLIVLEVRDILFLYRPNPHFSIISYLLFYPETLGQRVKAETHFMGLQRLIALRGGTWGLPTFLTYNLFPYAYIYPMSTAHH